MISRFFHQQTERKFIGIYRYFDNLLLTVIKFQATMPNINRPLKYEDFLHFYVRIFKARVGSAQTCFCYFC